MKNFFAFFIFLLLVSGCMTGSIDYTTQDVYNESALGIIKNWTMQYDTINGRILTSDLLGGSTETKFPDSTSPEELLDEPPKIAEERGQKLAGMIRSGMTSKISDTGEGVIKISRPFFKDKFILHTKVTFLDNTNNKIAEMDLFNRCEFDGQKTTMANNAMHDLDYARYCAFKIYELIGK